MEKDELNMIIAAIRTRLWQLKDKLPESEGRIVLEVLLHEGGVRKINVQTVLN